MKADSGRSSPSPFAEALERVDGVLEAGVDAGEAGEDLGDVERLAEEALDLPGAGHDELVLFGELVHAEDGDDVLQVLVALEDLLDAAGDGVVALADDVGSRIRRGRSERVDRGVDALLGDANARARRTRRGGRRPWRGRGRSGRQPARRSPAPK
jgi:hypothetical protein